MSEPFGELLLSTTHRRLNELLEGWRPDEHPELRLLVTPLAREFLIDTSRLEHLMTPAAAVGGAQRR